ncbi:MULTISPECIES: thioesterase family protein [unclassified Thermoactinomyces]|uniref:acyl-CoA thioesterase n=1 Tax=unclassified Thermoactinomyces TaxID=2634588 RepID=UPI0018DE4FC4|nr:MULTISPECIES: thioesterase family protein [unclassified Thermoactinomyces]MBH8597582.1 acyl-CoA thioesterase [Thermoactinomyces sp. CICC 10523]MBH8603923.1 acyl-CoA thioesterase [Thermoactinomyces sp. CICC 10522]MBH8606544.1 acyl-CoA thioesterase [Thermoactinomyces sp. CICC 10521]
MEEYANVPCNETVLRVRYQETDQMGVVYHTNYLVWFEIGRTELIRQFGSSYRKLEENGLLLPVVDIHCKYMHSAKYDDLVLIRTEMKELSGPKVVFSYEISNKETGVKLAKGTTTHLWVNKEMKRVNIKRAFPEIYELLVQMHNPKKG